MFLPSLFETSHLFLVVPLQICVTSWLMKMAFYFLLLKTEQVNHKGTAQGCAGGRCRDQEQRGIWVDDHIFVLLFNKTAFLVSRSHKHSWSCPKLEKSVFLFGFVLLFLCLFVFFFFLPLISYLIWTADSLRLFEQVLCFFKTWKNEVREAVKHSLYLSPTLEGKHGNMNNKSELLIISKRMSISRIHETPSFPELQLPVSDGCRRVSHFFSEVATGVSMLQ